MKVVYVLYAKPPFLGYVKTRLARHFGDEFALFFYQLMLWWQAALIEDLLKEQKKAKLEIHLALPEYISLRQGSKLFKKAVNRKLKVKFHKQSKGDLGERMAHTMEHAFQKYDRCVIWGSDVILMTKDILFEAGQREEVCLVPATDGGYSLIAISKKQFNPQIFSNIAWSSKQTYKQQKRNIQNLKLPLYEFSPIPDLDTVEDIAENLNYMESHDCPHYQKIAREFTYYLASTLNLDYQSG
ncbi:MAG: glycosyltransferase [Candidatus Hydrogenedentota bacterium]|nr:MAG: glycosyltransferase [Candidatus Hydrogenedentota bacterium]